MDFYFFILFYIPSFYFLSASYLCSFFLFFGNIFCFEIDILDINIVSKKS